MRQTSLSNPEGGYVIQPNVARLIATVGFVMQSRWDWRTPAAKTKTQAGHGLRWYERVGNQAAFLPNQACMSDLDSIWPCRTFNWPRIDWRPMKSLCHWLSTARRPFSFISLR